MLAGPARAQAEAGRAEPNDFLIRQQSGPDSIKGSIIKSKIFSFFKISYLIINKSHIFNNVHNLSLIFTKFLRSKNFFLKFWSSLVFLKVLINYSQDFCKICSMFYICLKIAYKCPNICKIFYNLLWFLLNLFKTLQIF